MNKKRNVFVLVGLLIGCFLVIGVSYAVWQLTLTQTEKNVVTTGCFRVEFTDQNPINLEKAYPISDEEGKSLIPYEFTLTNTCDSEANYYINLETITSADKKLSEQYLKASLKKGDSEVFLNTLNDTYINLDKVLPEASNAYKIYQDVLKANEVTTFYLNLWMDYDTPTIDEVMNATYEGKVTVSTSYKAPEKNLMMAMDFFSIQSSAGSADINQTYTNNNKYEYIDKVVYQNKINPYSNAVEVVDFSVYQDKSVLGYYVKSDTQHSTGNDVYTLYIQANGKIKINPIASYYGFGAYYDGIGAYITVEEIENWDTSLVTDMSHMFDSCQNESLDLSGFDTTNVTTMSEMFSGMRNLTNLNLSGFNTNKVTDMSYMFSRNANLNTIIYGENFIHKENANIRSMFSNCPANKPTHESWNGVAFE